MRECNEPIEQLAQQSYPQVALLRQGKRGSTLIGLTFLLTPEKPTPIPARVARRAAAWDCKQGRRSPGKRSSRSADGG